MFDIHYASDMDKAMKKLESKWVDPVTELTYFYQFFLYKFSSILNLDEKHLFSNTMGFKKKYMRQLGHESTMIHNALDSFRIHFIFKLVGKKKYFAQMWIILKWVASCY